MQHICKFILRVVGMSAVCFLIAIGTAWAGGQINSAQPPARPNIVFILTDDQRWDALGCAGHPLLKTPNLDRLAKEGARFLNAFVTTPVCSPSRASFLTGQYAHAHGVTGNAEHGELSRRLITFPRLLHKAGYETAYVGKWHMGNDGAPRPGFDRWVSFNGQGEYFNSALNIDGAGAKAEGYLTDILTRYALDFIKQPRQKPFALYLAHKAPHSPFIPAPRHEAMFAAEAVARRPNAQDDLSGKPVIRRKLEDFASIGPGAGPGDDLIRNQLRTLLAVDESVGRILKTLADARQLDDTIVIFTSDNGYFWGEHGLGDKRAAYEEARRVPLLVR